jgi:cytidylate kinase
VPVIAMTREMGSLGAPIGREVARRLGYEFLHDDLIRAVAREYRVREAGVVGAVERTPPLLDRITGRGGRYRVYLEAAVLDAARRERVVLMGRWSTVFLRGISHAVRVRVAAPLEVRVQRVMARRGVNRDEAVRRIAAYDGGVRARLRQVFDLEWSDPLLYDLVINTERLGLEAAVRQVVALTEAAEFHPSGASQAALEDRALAARVRAMLGATLRVDLDAEARAGQLTIRGLVASRDEAAAVAAAAAAVPGVLAVSSEVRVFRRPVR